MKQNKVILMFFSLIFLIISCIIYKNVSPAHSHKDIDSNSYIKKAELFCETNKFAETNNSQAHIMEHTIGYHFFIGMIYKLFGKQTKYIIWLQILLMLLTGFILFFAIQHISNPIISTMTFALFTINIGYLTFAQFILAETILIFFLVLFIERFFYFLKTKNLLALGLSGLSLGISTIVKPAGLYFIIPAAVFVAIFAFLKINSYKKFLAIPIIIISFLIPVEGYKTYNYINHGTYIFTSLGNHNLYVWFWGKVKGNKGKTSHEIKASTEK